MLLLEHLFKYICIVRRPVALAYDEATTLDTSASGNCAGIHPKKTATVTTVLERLIVYLERVSYYSPLLFQFNCFAKSKNVRESCLEIHREENGKAECSKERIW